MKDVSYIHVNFILVSFVHVTLPKNYTSLYVFRLFLKIKHSTLCINYFLICSILYRKSLGKVMTHLYN